MQITFKKKTYTFENVHIYLFIEILFSIFQLCFIILKTPFSVNLPILIAFLTRQPEVKEEGAEALIFITDLKKNIKIDLFLLIVLFGFLLLIFKDINAYLYHPIYFYFSYSS